MRVELFGYRFECKSIAAIRSSRAVPEPRKALKPDREASHEFWDSFQFGGTLVATCRCGRTHFCSNTSLDYDEGELEGLLKNAEEHPEKYIQDSTDDSVAVMDGPSGLLVWGCPCHGALPFENLLLDYKMQILDYYRRTAKSATEQLERERLAIADAAGGSDADK